MQKCTMHGLACPAGGGGCRTQSPEPPAPSDVVKQNSSKNNYSQGWGQVPTGPERIYCGAPLLSYLLRGGYMQVRVGVGVAVEARLAVASWKT